MILQHSCTLSGSILQTFSTLLLFCDWFLEQLNKSLHVQHAGCTHFLDMFLQPIFLNTCFVNKYSKFMQEAQQSLERITAVYANKVLRADFLEDEVPVLEPFGGEGKQQQLFRMVEAFGSRLTNGEKDKFKALVEEIFHEVPHDLKRRRKEEVLEAGDLGDPDAYMHTEGGIGDQGFGPHLG